MIGRAGFNPLHPEASSSVERLKRFHEIVARNSSRYFQTLTINDGAACYRDLSLRNRSVTHDFLMRAWTLFNEINADESVHGLPGVRLVLAAGFRIKGRKAGIDEQSKQFRSVIKRFQDKQISAEQAIREATAIRRPFDIIPQLQANFAFTKAYLAETGGKKSGFEGPKFFADTVLFEPKIPQWIAVDKIINWTNLTPPMTGSFAQVSKLLPYKHPEGGPLNIRDGLQIAQNLTHDSNVLQLLRATRQKTG